MDFSTSAGGTASLLPVPHFCFHCRSCSVLSFLCWGHYPHISCPVHPYPCHCLYGTQRGVRHRCRAIPILPPSFTCCWRHGMVHVDLSYALLAFGWVCCGLRPLTNNLSMYWWENISLKCVSLCCGVLPMLPSFLPCVYAIMRKMRRRENLGYNVACVGGCRVHSASPFMFTYHASPGG